MAVDATFSIEPAHVAWPHCRGQEVHFLISDLLLESNTNKSAEIPKVQSAVA